MTSTSQDIEPRVSDAADGDNIEALKPQGKVTEVQGDYHFYETVTASPLDPWSKTSIQLYMILLVAALNATASGFDGVSCTLSWHRTKAHNWA